MKTAAAARMAKLHTTAAMNGAAHNTLAMHTIPIQYSSGGMWCTSSTYNVQRNPSSGREAAAWRPESYLVLTKPAIIAAAAASTPLFSSTSSVQHRCMPTHITSACQSGAIAALTSQSHGRKTYNQCRVSHMQQNISHSHLHTIAAHLAAQQLANMQEHT